MLFSSISFLYYFLPVVFALYFALPRRFKNALLLVASLLFYFYGEPQYIYLMLFSSLVDYCAGILITKYRGTPKAKLVLIIAVLINLALLMFFKYADFLIANFNAVTGMTVPLLRIPLPLGISFYTFQTMSYSIDVYRGDATVQKNPLTFATYVTLFPQLVAGPIVRYQTVADEMDGRKHSVQDAAEGISRFIIGLGKKVLIANVLGELNTTAAAAVNQSVLLYWLRIVSFMLQIYFDFSGYSDMAIGMGRVFGFHFLENFNYPFIARSISEFWQRWHISMGTWFREYIYIPLGGNRVSKLKWLRNIVVVWFCTGFWHGAAWNFIIWGLFFGVMLVAEKFFLIKRLKALPRGVQHIYVLIIVTASFVIFHLETLPGIMGCFAGMIGVSGEPLYTAESLYYLKSYALVLALAVVGATPLIKTLVLKARDNVKLKVAVNVATPCVIFALLLVATAYLVDSSFNPFLYFRF
jgi:alginate O-acetyltransferase complex protein AlgI